jgi:hypothetical protein
VNDEAVRSFRARRERNPGLKRCFSAGFENYPAPSSVAFLERTIGAIPMTDLVVSRRRVLKRTGVASTLALAGGVLPNFGISTALAADLGEGDIGVLNYAYALEQLEAAFYTMVVDRMYAEPMSGEADILEDIRDHEVEHAAFLKQALGAKAIPDLDVDFSAVDFSSRKSVLTTAMTFEDLGVGAYNGAGKLIETPDYLVAAGRIVSVEARHAAVIRDLLNMNSVAFAGDDVVDKNGLDVAYAPAEVLPKAAPFITTPVTANGLM